MMRVLAIHSDTMGHTTCSHTWRSCFARSGQIDYRAFWSREERSLVSRVIARAAYTKIPGLASKDRNLDLSRARIEWSTGRMSRILAQRKTAHTHYDAIHFHTQQEAFGSVSLMRRVPTVLSIDMTVQQVARDLRFPWTARPNISMETRAFAAAAAIVAFSDWAARSLMEEYGVAPEKIHVISPGVRLWQLALTSVEARPMRRIVFVGSDFRRKGGWDLLDVFRKNFSDVAELHLITKQPIEDAGRNVFVHHDVKAYSPEWQAFLASADIFAMPSYFEGSPLVFSEAAAFGAALVGTDICGVPQMVREGENGFLVEPGNREQLRERLKQLIEDDGMRLRFRRRSRELALEEFDAEKNARRLGDLFLSLRR